MKILHLTLKKKWFDMIASGEKKQEYREIKQYWNRRLSFQEFDEIHFRNGYSKDAPFMKVKCDGIGIGYGLEKWGAIPMEKYFIIELGDIIS